jgi:hypothetical protein
MPKKSVAAQLMEPLRPELKHPQPPKEMDARAQQIWREIVLCRPATFFKPGAQQLLRTYCEISAVLEKIAPQLAAHPDGDLFVDRVRKLGTLQASLAQKLRLSIQSVLRRENAETVEQAAEWFPDGSVLQGRTRPPRPWDADA